MRRTASATAARTAPFRGAEPPVGGLDGEDTLRLHPSHLGASGRERRTDPTQDEPHQENSSCEALRSRFTEPPA